MDISAQETLVTDLTITFTISSQSGGPGMKVFVVAIWRGSSSFNVCFVALVHAVLLWAASVTPLPPSAVLCKFFESPEALSGLEGQIDSRRVTVLPQGDEDVTFTGLRPDSKYVLLVIPNYWPSSFASKVPSPALRSRAPYVCIARTAPEVLEVDWKLLSSEQRVMELRAAVKSELVQLRAACSQPPVYIPKDEEIRNMNIAGTGNNKQVQGFMDWWVGTGATGNSRVRSDFLYLEVCLPPLDLGFEPYVDIGCFVSVWWLEQIKRFSRSCCSMAY